jgi:hypothetical protein
VRLASLSVSTGTLNPSFNVDQREYRVTVPRTTTNITVMATAEDPGSTITGTGTFALNVGPNLLPVTVTAADGISARTYNVEVTRTPNDNTNLATLTVSSGTLNPTFDPAMHFYSVTVANTVTTINIGGTTQDPNASATGFGTFPLTVGANS